MFKPQDPNRFGDMISRLWVFALFVMIFRDLHEMATASTIKGILNGQFEGNPVTDAGLVAGGAVLVILIATMVLSSLLVPSAARRLNLVVSPFAIAGLFILPPNDPDDYLLALATLSAFVLIFWLCWNWKPLDAVSKQGTISHAL